MNQQSADSMRLFYALWPDDDTRAALMGLQTMLRGRIIPHHNLHITLAFLGSQAASAQPTLEHILNRLPPAALTLQIDRISYFNRNRIAWAGMHAAPQPLLDLQRQLVQALAEHDIAFDDKGSFKPHVTLARDAEPPPDTFFAPFTWQANQVALVQSKTGPGGADYTVLAMRRIDQYGPVG